MKPGEKVYTARYDGGKIHVTSSVVKSVGLRVGALPVQWVQLEGSTSRYDSYPATHLAASARGASALLQDRMIQECEVLARALHQAEDDLRAVSALIAAT